MLNIIGFPLQDKRQIESIWKHKQLFTQNLLTLYTFVAIAERIFILPFLSQNVPPNPFLQAHLKPSSLSLVQMPPFLQGETSHGNTRNIKIIKRVIVDSKFNSSLSDSLQYSLTLAVVTVLLPYKIKSQVFGKIFKAKVKMWCAYIWERSLNFINRHNRRYINICVKNVIEKLQTSYFSSSNHFLWNPQYIHTWNTSVHRHCTCHHFDKVGCHKVALEKHSNFNTL